MTRSIEFSAYCTGLIGEIFFNEICLSKTNLKGPGPIAQSVVRLTADPGVGSLILAWSHTSVEIDHEIMSTVIIVLEAPSAEGLLLVTSQSMCMKYWLTALANLEPSLGKPNKKSI